MTTRTRLEKLGLVCTARRQENNACDNLSVIGPFSFFGWCVVFRTWMMFFRFETAVPLKTEPFVDCTRTGSLV